MSRLQLIYDNKKPALNLLTNVLVALIAAFIAIYLDSHPGLTSRIPEVLLARTDIARSILELLSGIFLTIMTFTFSIIMVVLTMYSSSFSPRVVENFLTNNSTMNVLGVFVGGFIYCILTLFFMRYPSSGHLVISATLAVIYSIVSVAFFIRFVFSVSASVQVNNLIMQLYHSAADTIEGYVRQHDARNGVSRIYHYRTEDYRESITIHCGQNGYLEMIDSEQILALLADQHCRGIIHPRIGDFVSMNADLITILFNQLDVDKATLNKIRGCFVVQERRYVRHDYRFSLQKLTDVILRSLSPGINDPNTAISGIRMMGVLFGQLSQIDGDFTLFSKDGTDTELVYHDFNFKSDLVQYLGQFIHYGKGDFSVMLAILQSIEIALRVAPAPNAQILKSFAREVFNITGSQDFVQAHHELIQNKYDQIRTFN